MKLEGYYEDFLLRHDALSSALGAAEKKLVECAIQSANEKTENEKNARSWKTH